MADLSSPQFWRQLYSMPVDSNTHQSGSHQPLELEEGDLEAVLQPVGLAAEGMGLDHGAVAALVETLVKERIAEMLATGELTAGAPSPGGHTQPPFQSTGAASTTASDGPRASAAPSEPASASARRKAPRPASPAIPVPGAGERRRGEPTSSDRSSLEVSQPSLRTVERAKLNETQSPPPPLTRSSTPTHRSPPTPKPRAAAAAPARAKAPSGVGAAMWERVPVLPGGPGALLGAGDLSPEAISVLVLVNGNTTLQGLRTLVPQLDDASFLSIIREALRGGVLELN